MYSVDLLSAESKKKYIYLIIFLMLLANQYLSLSFVNKKLKIEIPISSFPRIIRDISECSGKSIELN